MTNILNQNLLNQNLLRRFNRTEYLIFTKISVALFNFSRSYSVIAWNKFNVYGNLNLNMLTAKQVFLSKTTVLENQP